MIQNKVPPKLGDPGSFLIPCNFNKTFSCNALADLGASINLMPYSLYAKLSLETLKPTKMSVRLADRSFQYPVGIAENMLVEVGKFTFPADFVILEMEEDSKVPLILGRPFLHTADAVIRVKQKQLNLGVGTERMIFNIDSAMKHSYSNDDTCFSIDVIDEILEEDFYTLLDEGSKILYSIEGTLLEEEIFAEFDEFMAMTADENSDSNSDTEDPPFEKITINTDYKIKTSLEEPPKDLKLKPLPNNLEYHKQAFAWKTTDIPGICPSFCKHKIQLLDDKKPVVQKQRRLNPNMQEVVKKEIVKLLDTGIIYPIADSPWVSPIHCVQKKGGITVVTNENDELVPTRTVTGWRVCIDYRKLNEATAKDHFPLPFMDQMHARKGDSTEFIILFPRWFSVLLFKFLSRSSRPKLGKMSLHGQRRDCARTQDFSKIARPLTKLLEKDTPFEFDDECRRAFESLKEKLTCAPVIVSPNWNLPFELMCDASDFAIGAVAFLYGTIEEEVYVHQPRGFVDLAHPNKVYKVIKALYGLHQAPRAWYETLSSFLIENGFRRGRMDLGGQGNLVAKLGQVWGDVERLGTELEELWMNSIAIGHHLVDDDLDEEEAIKVTEKKNLENDIVDETLEIDKIVNIKEYRNHPLENFIGNLNQRTLRDEMMDRVTMQEELNQFIANDVWELVSQPKNMTIIGTKWVFRNKLDENGVVSRNKARLVAQGNQQEGIDYDETYALVARLESIRILLAYACALDFKLFQMDVKSAFLNGFINEESYVWYDRVMNPLTAQQEQKIRKDRGTRRGRHSTFSSSAFDQLSSSHLNDDDDDGNGERTSRASTLSPIRYVNSLTNEVP
ncbi:reverse transcriptase domain-containing protein [Tanacetum coccineum]